MGDREQVYFRKDEQELADFAGVQGKFSDYIKELIQRDMDRQQKHVKKRSIYDVYLDKDVKVYTIKRKKIK